MSREHIWADWLKAYIPKDMLNHRRYKAIVHRSHIAETTKIQAGDPKSRRVRCVCKGCNEGWMSDVQQAAKPHVVRMLAGHRATFDSAEQRIIASWVSMAVIVAEQDDGGQQAAISQADRDWLHATKMAPPGWRIWLGRFRRGATFNPDYVRFGLRIAEHDASQALPDQSPLPYNTQTATFIVGDILFHAMSSAPFNRDLIQGWMFRERIVGSLIELSPPARAILDWPPIGVLTDNDADVISSSFRRYVQGRTTI